jgi:hypothetical protein
VGLSHGEKMLYRPFDRERLVTHQRDAQLASAKAGLLEDRRRDRQVSSADSAAASQRRVASMRVPEPVSACG